MAVARIATISGTQVTGSSATLTNNTATGNAPTSDLNTIVLVGVNQSVSNNSSSTSVSVTYGGVAMTQLDYAAGGSSTNRMAIGIFYLFNPPTGAQTIVATSGGTSTKTAVGVGGAIYSGVSLTLGTVFSSFAAGPWSIPSVANGMDFIVLSNGADITAISGATQLFDAFTSVGGVGDAINVSEAAGTGSNISFNFTGSALTQFVKAVPLSPSTKIATLTDNFATQDTAKWDFVSSAAVTGGQLVLTHPSTPSAEADSKSGVRYTLAGSSMTVQVPQHGTGGDTWFIMYAGARNTTSWVSMRYVGTTLVMDETTAGSTDSTTVTFNATAHLWWRIRLYDNVLYWETSPDGFTWTIQRYKTAANNYGNGEVQFYAAHTSGATKFDNFNLPVAAAKMATLTDEFDTKDTAKWDWGAGAAQSSGTAVLTARTDYLGYIATLIGYDLTASALVVDWAQLADPTNANVVNQLWLYTTIWGRNGLYIGGGSNGLSLQWQKNGVAQGTPGWVTPYSATNHRFWRIRETSGTVYWETSPDGSTWTTQRSETNVDLDISSLQVVIQVGYATSIGTPTTAIVNAINPAPGIGGTLACTLQKLSSAMTAIQTQTGTMDTTLPKVTTSMTGAMQPSGTIAVTLQKLASAMTGAQIYTGTMAATMQTLKAALAAVMQPSGTMATTLQRITTALAATQTQTGTISAVVQMLSASLSGAMQPSGAIAVTIQLLKAALTAEQAQTGAIVADLQKVSAAITGEQPYSGTMASSLAYLTAFLAGDQTVTGTIDAALSLIATSILAVQESAGTMDSTLQVMVTEMIQGGTGVEGAMDSTLQPTRAEMTAEQGYVATMDTALSALTNEMWVEQTLAGTMDSALGKVLSDMAGEQGYTGIMDSALPTVQAFIASENVVTGTINVVLSRASSDMTGAQLFTGTMDSVVSAVVSSMTAKLGLTGTMDSTLSRVASDMAGKLGVTGTIDVTVVTPKADLLGYQAQTGTMDSTLSVVRSQMNAEVFANRIDVTLQDILSSASGGQEQTGTIAAVLRPLKTSMTGAMHPSGTMASSLTGPKVEIFGIILVGQYSSVRMLVIEAEDRTLVIADDPRMLEIADDVRVFTVGAEERDLDIDTEDRTDDIEDEDRTLYISAEERAMTVGADDRTLYVEAEDRTLEVEAEDRTLDVEAEDRAVVVPPEAILLVEP